MEKACISFFCAGRPQPRGSKRAFPIRRKDGTAGVSVTDSNPKSDNWMAMVSQAAQEAMNGHPPLTGPVSLCLEFIMPRPKYHYGTGAKRDVLKLSAAYHHTIAPDRTKLTRGTEDALAGIVFENDAQVVAGWITKHYGERPGVLVRVEPLDEPAAGQ